VTTYETLRIEGAEGLATLTLNRPERLNTLSIQLRQEFGHAIDELEADPDVRVLIITGAGRVFCAGLELSEWSAPGRVAAGAYDADAVAMLQRFSGPVIGAINGACVTGGLELALACDLLIASTEASFADTHALVGLIPGWGGSVRLARRIGLPRAKELALTGRPLSASEALGWGLVNHVVPAEELLPRARAMAQEMLAAVPSALIAYRRLLDDEYARTMGDALVLEREASLAANTSVTRDEIDARLSANKAARAARKSRGK
jgi:enoyl-CoA hydratase